MPGFEVWDLVKVPFPYADRPVQQRRPALVVAIPDAPGGPQLLWVLMVTSAANRGWPGDVMVSDLAAAGLPAPSVIRCAKIATIEALDAERIGRLPEGDRRLVTAAFRLGVAQALSDLYC
jgi:mRNA interferase MazF